MPFTFTMPKLSPTMEEGVIAKWLKKEGEFVEAGEVLLEVTTDKATVEHTALDEGWLKKILVKEGSSAKVNQPIALFTAEESESIEGYLVEPIPSSKAETSSSQAASEITETASPQAAQTAPAFSQPVFSPEAPLEDYRFPFPETDEIIKASPLAKHLAKEKGLDLGSVKGSGPGGRITSKDLELAQPKTAVAFGKKETPKIAPGTYEEIPLSPMRKTISKRLQESKSFIPHFYVKQTIGAEAMVELREQLKNLGIKVTFNDLVIKACALALKMHPGINAGFNSLNQTIISFKTIDISVAVTIPNGLITPIIRHADYKNVGQISSEVKKLVEKAKSGKLQENEYKGGSFCVSNLGMYGITEFSAVINPPQAAILAIGGIEDAAVVKKGVVQAGKTLALVLSADHRVIDGSMAAEFIKSVQFFLENPASLVM